MNIRKRFQKKNSHPQKNGQKTQGDLKFPVQGPSRFNKRLKPALEILFVLSSIFFYIWVVERRWPHWLNAVFLWGVCVGVPIVCIYREQHHFPEFSLDWRLFKRAFRLVFWFTTAATILLIGVGLHYEQLNYDGHFLHRVSEYFFWAFLQQIGTQVFLTRRVHRVVKNEALAAFASASLFALIHFPNPALMAFTWIGGFFWSYAFLNVPNLYVLAFSQGWLAVVALHCVPPAWLHNLRIGPTFWTY